MDITPAFLTSTGVSAARAAVWAGPLDLACKRHSITTSSRLLGFLPCIEHESGDFSAVRESLNYTPARLLELFGGLRRLRSGRQVYRITPEQAQAWGRLEDGHGHVLRPASEEWIANAIYGGPWGAENLGNTQPGDGWLFRGMGPMETTGRSNFAALAKAIAWAKPLEELPAFVATVEGGCEAAAFFWASRGCNALADQGDYRAARRVCNGGDIGMDDYLARVARMRPLLAVGSAPPPAAVAPTRPAAGPAPAPPAPPSRPQSYGEYMEDMRDEDEAERARTDELNREQEERGRS